MFGSILAELGRYLRYAAGPFNLYQLFNLGLATATNIGALYLTIVAFFWWRRLGGSHTVLRPMILALCLSKASLAFWTFSVIVSLVLFDRDPLIFTMPARIVWLIVVLIEVSVTSHFEPGLRSLAEEVMDLLRPRPDVGSPRLRRLVLVCDDNEALARLYRRCLEGVGYVVGVAFTGGDALLLASQLAPDLVILDLALPDRDGVTVSHELRAAGYMGPLILVSGVLDLMDREKLSQADFVDILSKPLTRRSLIDAVARALPNRRATDPLLSE